MTATAASHTDLLQARLGDLRAERDAALAETRQEAVGDIVAKMVS